MNEFINNYIECGDQGRRIELLTSLKEKKQSISISLAEDLLLLKLSKLEKLKLLDITYSSNNIALEDFFMQGIKTWDQDLATAAIRHWVNKTDHLLWYRVISFATSSHVEQRIRYTILDRHNPYGGNKLSHNYAHMDGLKDYSPAFQALILEKAIQWDTPSSKLSELSRSIIQKFKNDPWPSHKSFLMAINYLLKFEDNTEDFFSILPAHIKDLIQISKEHYQNSKTKTIKKLQSLLNEKNSLEAILKVWPVTWARSSLSSEILLQFITLLYNSKLERTHHNQLFLGVNANKLLEAICEIENTGLFNYAINTCKNNIPLPLSPKLIEHAKNLLIKADNPASFFAALPTNYRFKLNSENKTSNQEIEKIAVEEEKTFTEKDFDNYAHFADKTNLSDEVKARKVFFQVAYRNQIPKLTGNDYWSLLAKNWVKQDEKDLDTLAIEARKSPHLFKLCFINVLGKFYQSDKAVLKLSDFVHSKDEVELRAVIQSLGEINSSKSLQTLVSILTRNNINFTLQLEICNLLKEANLEKIQGELRSAYADINTEDLSDQEITELKEALASLILPISEAQDEKTKVPDEQITKQQPSLDDALSAKIKTYSKLSSEVKRALRTAQFFHDQISKSSVISSIDLSPVIDMQYKALELLFRETFQDASFQIVNHGILQRKLDVIGYARPIPKAMDEFENYISELPVVDTIPYFSKFKLRKMLRAICQYRPGRRFTLDGIKAFSLFFLCFSRQKCPYGLQNIIELGFKSDEKLAEFAKRLHIFQDFRNRAAHEGFHPDARHDIDEIWNSTAIIIETVFHISKTFYTRPSTQSSSIPTKKGKNSAVIIEKKKNHTNKAS